MLRSPALPVLMMPERGDVTFLANPRYTPSVNTTQGSRQSIYPRTRQSSEEIPVSASQESLPRLHTRATVYFIPNPSLLPSVHESAVIDPSAVVAENVWIGAGVVIGPSSRIAEGVRLHPNVTIYEDVTVGKDSTIHSGAVIREAIATWRNVSSFTTTWWSVAMASVMQRTNRRAG